MAMDKITAMVAGVLYGIAAGLAAGIVLAFLFSTPIWLPIPVGLAAGLALARRFTSDVSWAAERGEHVVRSAAFVAAFSAAAFIISLPS